MLAGLRELMLVISIDRSLSGDLKHILSALQFEALKSLDFLLHRKTYIAMQLAR